MKKIKIKNKTKLEVIRSLNTMLSSGIPIEDAVNSLANQSTGPQKFLFTAIRDNIHQGRTISTAFAEFPDSFDEVTVNSIKNAEETGSLESTLNSLTKHLEKNISFQANLISALTYPILVSVIFTIVFTFILMFVVPKITVIFYALHVNIPVTANIMIFISELLNSYWYIFLSIILIFAGIIFYLVTQKRKALQRILFRLPIISKIGIQMDLEKFTSNLGLLLSTGIPMNISLSLCEIVVTNKEILDLIYQLENAVLAGKEMSTVLIENPKYIPDTMVLMVQTGEKTGTLDKSMTIISREFELEIYNKVKRITSLIEPIIIFLIALMVFLLMFSIIIPIYQLVGTIRSV